MTTRHSSYKWNRLCAALERATEPKETYEEVKARMEECGHELPGYSGAIINAGKDGMKVINQTYPTLDTDERPLPFDYQSDYVPESEEK